MKSRILSFLGIGAIALAVACNTAEDETTNADSLTETSVDANTTADASATGSVQTSADGRRYVVRARSGSGSGSGSTASGSTGSSYDTVWLYMGTEDRYYTLGGSTGRDTLYYNTEDWNSWWNNPETDNELKLKSGDSKVKVDDDGSWKVKDADSKTKSDEDGKVKTKPKGDKS